MAAVTPLPCPVRLGIVKDGGPTEQLHKFTVEKNLHKMEKLLKKGVEVDSVNHLGQTPLFCASLLGLTSAVELLLRYGADPNHRCEDRSTPVHAAVFSCKPWLLSGVLDAGGDLRLHDHKGHTPPDWAKAGAQEHSPRMVDFLKRCTSHMHSLCQPPQPTGQHRTPSSSRTLLHSPSLLEFLRPGGSGLQMNRKLSTKLSLHDTVQCFGFGKLRMDRPRLPLGLLASLPIILDTELGQADDEPMVSYACGSFLQMTNYSWKGCRVTVKELQSHNARGSFLDLLITEQEYCSQLYHPHLLQLLAVSMSTDLQLIRLVFERVHIGSLHNLLHHRRDEFPVLQVEVLLTVVLQVCEALLFLHGRGLVMRSLSSHAVQMVHPGVGKVTGLGYMVPSSDSTGPGGPAHLPLPHCLYNWAAPEVIRWRACSGKADLYSLCALIQELYTDSVPWGPVDPRWIRQAVESGQALTADLNIPQPYYQLVRAGLQHKAQDRTSSLQDLRYLLRCDIRELSQSGEKGAGRQSSGSGRFRATGWSPEAVQNNQERGQTGEPTVPAHQLQERFGDIEEGQRSGQGDSMVEQEIEAQLDQLDQLLERQEEQEVSTNYNSAQSSPQTTSHENISLDDCHLTLTPLLESSQDSGSESSSTPSGELEWQVLRGPPLQPETPSKETEYIGSVVLNLKVSQVLLQQSENSLRAVEAALGDERYWQCGLDEVDGMGADEPNSRWRENTREMPFTRAKGPPSHGYTPFSRVCPEAGTPQGASGTEGHTPWHRCYREVERRDQIDHTFVGDQELTNYSSAQDESFFSPLSRLEQVERGNLSSGGTERRGQQSASRQELEDRTIMLSTMSCSPRSPTNPLLGWSDKSNKARWTNEVSEVVARMARGRFGTTPCSCSSDSEEKDKMIWAGRQDPLEDTKPCRPDGELQATQSIHSSTELEHLFKSFAGIQSESDDGSDFHTVNRTLNMTCGVWEGVGQKEEENASDSDYAQSPPEPSSMFYTPNPDMQPDSTGGCSQTLSSEGDLEVTLEVCHPASAAAGVAAESRPEESHSPLEEPAVTNPAASQIAPFTVASSLIDVAELAELSSISCSPMQHQEWAGPESQRPSPLSRRPAPCNSTPRSPVGSPRLRPAVVCAEPPPQLQSLIDTSPWSNTPSQPLTSETFATATLGDSSRSTTETSASSILQSPTQGAAKTKGMDTPSGPQELPMASWDERQVASVSVSHDDVHARESAPTGCSIPEEASGTEWEAQAAGGAAVVMRPTSLKERDLRCSNHGWHEVEHADTSTPAGRLGATTPVGCLSEGGEEISTKESVVYDDKDMPDEEEMPDREVEEEISGKDNPKQEEGFDSLSGSGITLQRDQKWGPYADFQGIMDETQRAHSTLDEDLQGMLLEMAAGQGVTGTPGTVEVLKTQDGLRSEKMTHPGGDTMEAVVAEEKMDSLISDNFDEQEEKLETVNHESWSRPHRVIVLEQTPPKSQSESDHVLDKEAVCTG